MDIKQSKMMQLGKAGEHLVCADLILKGYVAFLSEQGLAYDVLLDSGKKLIKIQVKTTQSYKLIPQRNIDTKAYIFNIKRCGKGNSQRYKNDEIDIFALVCLDTKKIGYIKNCDMPDTINLRVDSLAGSYYDEKGVLNYKKIIELSKETKNQSEIARILNINVSTVNRMLKPSFIPYKTTAKYFSDIERSKEWFLKI